MTGFDWEFGGRVSNWQGGALAKIPGGCELRFGFNPWADAPDLARDKGSGDKEFGRTGGRIGWWRVAESGVGSGG